MFDTQLIDFILYEKSPQLLWYTMAALFIAAICALVFYSYFNRGKSIPLKITPTIFLFLFLGFFGMCFYSQYKNYNDDTNLIYVLLLNTFLLICVVLFIRKEYSNGGDINKVFSCLKESLYILLVVVLGCISSVVVLYYVFYDNNFYDITLRFFYILALLLSFTLVYEYLIENMGFTMSASVNDCFKQTGGTSSKNKLNNIFNIIKYSILYIPCLLHSLFKKSKESAGITSPIYYIIIIALAVVLTFILIYPLHKEKINKRFNSKHIPFVYRPENLDVEKKIPLKIPKDLLEKNKGLDKRKQPVTLTLATTPPIKILNKDYNIKIDYSNDVNLSKDDIQMINDYHISLWFYLNDLNSCVPTGNIFKIDDFLELNQDVSQNLTLTYYANPFEEVKHNYTEFEKQTNMTLKPLQKERQKKWAFTHTIKDIKISSWNNLVISHHGNILDLYLNGKLVKSENNYYKQSIVHSISDKNIILGENNCISGKICNSGINLYKISSFKIKLNYDMLKLLDTPILF